MLALSRLVDIDPAIAGDAVVAEAELQKKLGRAAFLTWQILCARREYNGETHITVRGILRAKHRAFAGKLSRTQLCVALARLESAKLIENRGYQSRVVSRKDTKVVADVYVRIVRGGRLVPMRGQPNDVMVPRGTKAWMTTAAGWGGSRPGAGRKAPAWEPLELSIANSRRDPVLECDQESRRDCLGTAIKNQVGASIENMNSKREKTGCGVPLPSVGETRGAASAPPASLEIGGGLLAGGATRMAPTLGLPLQGVPRFPGISVIGAITIPDAPLLDGASTDEVLATELAKAYRGAIEHRYGGRCWVLAKGDITKAKQFRALVSFASHLMEHEIPPAAWCIWRVDRWRASPVAKRGNRPVQPTLNYVFAPKAIDDGNRWQYRVAYGTSRLGGKVIFTEAHTELLTRYKRMHSDITRGVKRAMAVEKHFPDGLYERLLSRARTEAVAERNRIVDQIRRGMFVW